MEWSNFEYGNLLMDSGEHVKLLNLKLFDQFDYNINKEANDFASISLPYDKALEQEIQKLQSIEKEPIATKDSDFFSLCNLSNEE
jgi:predicted nuclease of predicted toxin-antitoxin system